VPRFDLDKGELAGRLAEVLPTEPPYRADQIWEGLYRHGVGPDELTTLPKAVRLRLGSEPWLQPSLQLMKESSADRGRTVKWLWALSDGRLVETVLMEYGAEPGSRRRASGSGRTTACVSSQAGCAMGCSFCATGQAGFQRHLTVGEIVEQVVGAAAASASRGRRLTNVVFMGMGEPLANYDRVWTSIERIHSGLGLSARHITVSTVGIVPGIRRLAAERLPVNLAVSIHAANDRLRDELVPVNRQYPLGPVVEACRVYRASHGRRLSFEWALIDGVNDRPQDAEELAGLALPLAAHVNLIPLNPTSGYEGGGTSPARVRSFREELRSLGVNATIRQNRGTAIDAACGQLASRADQRSWARLA
jgi:23S rRNA (adenine2503-C2)-methyltransferase